MEIEFDSNKDTVNIEKHGLSLANAAKLEWEYLLVKQDDRNEYNEVRMIGYAPIDNRVYCVVYTDRDGIRRIISLRKENKREVTYYANQI
ncbi:MAG: BrnT family toxin [Methylococcaceae bacterium]|nr:BrnT family toxin [Methylococcaceae bacterium]